MYSFYQFCKVFINILQETRPKKQRSARKEMPRTKPMLGTPTIHPIPVKWEQTMSSQGSLGVHCH